MPKYLKRVSAHVFQPIDESEAINDISHLQAVREPCYLCMDRTSDAVLIDCGHGGLCTACADALWLSGVDTPGGRQCPLCRRQINSVLHIVSEIGSSVLVEPQHYPELPSSSQVGRSGHTHTHGTRRTAWGEDISSRQTTQAAQVAQVQASSRRRRRYPAPLW